MIDQTVKNLSVVMVKMDMTDYPRYELPEGFYITGYKEGYENEWAAIAKEQFVLDSLEAGLKSFKDEFWCDMEVWEKLKDSCLFAVEDKTGKVAAILSLWEGSEVCKGYFRRIHWVATREEFQGKGIIKAMMTYAHDLYHKQGATGPCFCVTGTPNWQAIRIYKKFGYEPYMALEHQPEPIDAFDPARDIEPWEIINGKIAEFEANKK